MHPPLFMTDIKENKINKNKLDKKLCKDLCGVFTCLSCVCVVYLIFFTHVINDELNMNITIF
tara:strand:- start:2688 stop:2873 length:186 start_codon:yes stop_codon:yes gene_type:complete